MIDLNEIARRGARKMLAYALEAYFKAAKEQRDEVGRVLLVRNGYACEREILLGAGVIEVGVPRVSDLQRGGSGDDLQAFRSSGRGKGQPPHLVALVRAGVKFENGGLIR